MPMSLILAFLWVVGANILAMTPGRDGQWRAAYALIAVGIPILGYVTYQTGPLMGFLSLLAAMSVLRWPVVCLWRWMRGARSPAPATEMAED